MGRIQPCLLRHHYWVFEGGPPAGSMTLRLRVGAPQGREAPATGIRASSIDAGWAPLFDPTGVRVEASDVGFQRETTQGPGLTGRLTGTMVFVGPDGSRATCSEARLKLTPGLP